MLDLTSPREPTAYKMLGCNTCGSFIGPQYLAGEKCLRCSAPPPTLEEQAAARAAIDWALWFLDSAPQAVFAGALHALTLGEL